MGKNNQTGKLLLMVIITVAFLSTLSTAGGREKVLEIECKPQSIDCSDIFKDWTKDKIEREFRRQITNSEKYHGREDYKIHLKLFKSELLGKDYDVSGEMDQIISDYSNSDFKGIVLAYDLSTESGYGYKGKKNIREVDVWGALRVTLDQADESNTGRKTFKLAKKLASKVVGGVCDKEIPQDEEKKLNCVKEKRKYKIIDYYLDPQNCEVKKKITYEKRKDSKCSYEYNGIARYIEPSKEPRKRINLNHMAEKGREFAEMGRLYPNSPMEYLRFSLEMESKYPLQWLQRRNYLKIEFEGDKNVIKNKNDLKLTLRSLNPGMMPPYRYEVIGKVKYQDITKRGVKRFVNPGKLNIKVKVKPEKNSKFEIADNFELEFFSGPEEYDCKLYKGDGDSQFRILVYGTDYPSLGEFKEHVENSVKDLFTYEPFQSNKDLFDVSYYNNVHQESHKILLSKVSGSTFYGPPASIAGKCPTAEGKSVHAYLIKKDFRSIAPPWYNAIRRKGKMYVSTGSPGYPNVFVHELGHAFANIKDEYVGGKLERLISPIMKGKPNCAPNRKKAKRWWGDLAEKEKSVDYFKGCGYNPNYIKPHKCSVMSRETCKEKTFGLVNIRHICKVMGSEKGICSRWSS